MCDSPLINVSIYIIVVGSPEKVSIIHTGWLLDSQLSNKNWWQKRFFPETGTILEMFPDSTQQRFVFNTSYGFDESGDGNVFRKNWNKSNHNPRLDAVTLCLWWILQCRWGCMWQHHQIRKGTSNYMIVYRTQRRFVLDMIQFSALYTYC